MSQRNQFLVVLTVITALILLTIIHYFFFLETYIKAPRGTRSHYEYSAVLARYYHFDGIIAGTSVSENFKCTEFDRLNDTFSYKMTVPACPIKRLCLIVEYASKHQSLRVVMADLHNQMTLEAPPPAIPDDDYYTDRNFWGHVRDAVSLKTLKARRKYYTSGPAKNLSRDEMYNWMEKTPCGKKYLARSLFRPAKTKMHLSPEYAVINMEQFLVPLVRNHPEIKFYFYLPPFTPFIFAERKEFLAARKPIMDYLLPLPNVELYDFQAAEIVTDWDEYKDSTHYSEQINSWIIDQIRQGNYRVTPQNRQEFDDRLAALLKSFDAEKEKAALKPYLTK